MFNYLVDPYTILKCLNVVWMSIFNYIFIYFYFQDIFAVLGEILEISLFPIDHHSFPTVRIFGYCCIYHNCLNYLQGVYHGCYKYSEQPNNITLNVQWVDASYGLHLSFLCEAQNRHSARTKTD